MGYLANHRTGPQTWSLKWSSRSARAWHPRHSRTQSWRVRLAAYASQLESRLHQIILIYFKTFLLGKIFELLLLIFFMIIYFGDNAFPWYQESSDTSFLFSTDLFLRIWLSLSLFFFPHLGLFCVHDANEKHKTNEKKSICKSGFPYSNIWFHILKSVFLADFKFLDFII